MSTDTRHLLLALLAHWPVAILLPVVVLVIVACILVTRIWDGHDERLREASVPAPAGGSGPTEGGTSQTAPAGVDDDQTAGVVAVALATNG